MKNHPLLRLAFVGASGMLLAGCLFKPTTVTTRSFVLSPVPSPANRAALAHPPAIGVGLVRMPSYLLRSGMALRKSGGEVEYMETAIWAERLDLSFQRVLAANLAALLPTDQVRVSVWKREDVAAAVQVNVEQFDVDADGRGTLVAWWRIEVPGGDKSARSGESRLTRAGSPPRSDPKAMVETLNGLTEEFSRGLAQSLRECLASESNGK